jgi:hypothetical protein
MKFLIMQFSPTSCHFISLRYKYSDWNLFGRIIGSDTGLRVVGVLSQNFTAGTEEIPESV